MKAWLLGLFATPPSPAPSGLRAPASANEASRVPAAPSRHGAPLPLADAAGVEMPLLAWMAGGAAFAVGPAGPREQAALLRLDRLIADTGAHPRLLARAAAVIPPLLARLRSPALSLSDLAAHISRDMTLVSEIIRVANSSHYRREAAIVELDHALRLLGVEGLRSAIARAVLKPLLDVRGGKLAAGGAARLWQHTDKKAQLCSAQARGMGLDPFEACMAALAHNAVWSAVWRRLDEIDADAPWRLSPAFVQALGARRNRLFAIVARQWQLADSALQAAAEMGERGPAAELSPMTRLLDSGERLAWLLCHPDRIRAAELAAPWLQEADATLRACYDALSQANAQEVSG